MLAGLRVMGFTEESIQDWVAKDALDNPDLLDFEVHEDNWDSLLFFFSVGSQWRYQPYNQGARRCGLDYTGVEAGCRLSGRPRSSWPALFADLRVIEKAVLEADTEAIETA